MKRRDFLATAFLATAMFSCSSKEKIPQKLRVDVNEDFFINSYKGQLSGGKCFTYKMGEKELYLIPNLKEVGVINRESYPGLDSLALSYTEATTAEGPIYQIDELIGYVPPDSTSKK